MIQFHSRLLWHETKTPQIDGKPNYRHMENVALLATEDGIHNQFFALIEEAPGAAAHLGAVVLSNEILSKNEDLRRLVADRIGELLVIPAGRPPLTIEEVELVDGLIGKLRDDPSESVRSDLHDALAGAEFEWEQGTAKAA